MNKEVIILIELQTFLLKFEPKFLLKTQTFIEELRFTKCFCSKQLTLGLRGYDNSSQPIRTFIDNFFFLFAAYLFGLNKFVT